MEKKIFSKLDWFSGVFKNVSIAQICQEFSIVYDFDMMDLVTNQYISNTSAYGTGGDIVIELLPGVSLRVQAFKYMTSLKVDISNKENLKYVDPLALMNYKWSDIILSCSGNGLDFLRDLGYNVDENLRNYFPGIIREGENSFHVTRADFAFDFVNWCPDFMSDMKTFLNNKSPQGERIFCGNNTQPIIISPKYSAGKERTLYFGSTGSDKLLRIYDKLLQCQSNLPDSVPVEYKDYNESTGEYKIPESWIRIELQTRREIADKLLTGTDPNKFTKIDCEFWDKKYWVGVLRWIFDYYAPKPAYNADPIDCWINLFEWSSIETVIKNAKYVSPRSPLDKSESFYSRNIKTIICVYAETPVIEKYTEANEYLIKLQKDGGDEWKRFYNRLLNQKTPGYPQLPSNLIRNKEGYFVFKDIAIIENSLDFYY